MDEPLDGTITQRVDQRGIALALAAAEDTPTQAPLCPQAGNGADGESSAGLAPSLATCCLSTVASASTGETLPTSYLGLPISTDATSLEKLLLPAHKATEEAPRPPKVTEEVFHRHVDNTLVQVRLGVAAALYQAIRLKSPPLAAHGLRVALVVSAWGEVRGLDPEQRRLAEVAALLHDVGMIGLPDRILLKPGPLDPAETLLVENARSQSAAILRVACEDERLPTIVGYVGRWFDGSRGRGPSAGTDIPLPARMITIAEAFDSMTHDQVYRPAMTTERAVAELFAHAGSQFDPQLVDEFATVLVKQLGKLVPRAAAQWLGGLDPAAAGFSWRLQPADLLPQEASALFPVSLLEQMRDGVIFVDTAGRIVGWNPAAERLSGISASTVLGRLWSPALLGLRDERGQEIAVDDCPVQAALLCGAQSLRRMTLRGRSGREVPVDLHVIPVPHHASKPLGAILVLHDVSPEASLEAECHRLQARTSLDPLTQLANRAELDRLLPIFVAQHRDRGIPCSLVVCDLDHFKKINDTFGHPAGDEVIKAFANVLKASLRPGDVAARYGGEEFVLLCAGCDGATAVRRAEQIRFRFAQIPHPSLDHKTATASFGVTELQPGDTPESFFRRADRALMAAKVNGRNQVVQLGSGTDWTDPGRARPWWLTQWTRNRPATLLRQTLRVDGPMAVAVEKLQGFVSDHQAKVLTIRENRVELELVHRPIGMRRQGDRPVVFRMLLTLSPPRAATGVQSGQAGKKFTIVEVQIEPASGRERRRQELLLRAESILESLQAYLMAQPVSAEEPTPGEVKAGLWGWLFGQRRRGRG
ncbi:MAG: diguanylate cyclase [Thermoguttaceae bacterium]|nr:diguanylate cyclase [Thermoguttaceae bacterium]MDW8080121.1 diguanylate cyclase [Thermoguttaceae bacterium]